MSNPTSDHPARADDTLVAFVRAVMHGRDGLHRHVLIDAFARAGATGVTTHLTTGNVSFRCDRASTADLQAEVEDSLERIVGRRTDLFIRRVDDLDAMRRLDPFVRSPLTVDHERHVTFLAGPPPADLDLPITVDRGEISVFETGERELFSVSARIDGRSRGPGGVIERTLGQRVTTRAWSTIERILDVVG